MMMMVQAPLPIAVRLPRRRAGTEATPACPPEIPAEDLPDRRRHVAGEPQYLEKNYLRARSHVRQRNYQAPKTGVRRNHLLRAGCPGHAELLEESA